MADQFSYPVTSFGAPVRVVIDGSIQFDASVSERHGATVSLTKHPVEVGADITDHAKVEPETVVLEGLFTNTPLNALERTARGESAPLARGYAQESYDAIHSLKNARKLVTVTTEARTYANMMITDLTMPRDAKTGDAVRFSVTLTEIVFARNELVAIARVKPADVKKATKVEKQGKKTGEETEGMTSWIKAAFNDGGVTEKGSGIIAP